MVMAAVVALVALTTPTVISRSAPAGGLNTGELITPPVRADW